MNVVDKILGRKEDSEPARSPGRPRKEEGTQAKPLKTLEVVRRGENNETIVDNVDVTPQTTVLDIKKSFKLGETDTIVRAATKQSLGNAVKPYEVCEDGEKLFHTLETGIGSF